MNNVYIEKIAEWIVQEEMEKEAAGKMEAVRSAVSAAGKKVKEYSTKAYHGAKDAAGRGYAKTQPLREATAGHAKKLKGDVHNLRLAMKEGKKGNKSSILKAMAKNPVAQAGAGAGAAVVGGGAYAAHKSRKG